MKLSTRGARLIEAFEGFRSRPYRDSAGVWTIGYGSTHGVTSRTPAMTKAQAEARMRLEVDNEFGRAINALELPLNQNQFDALVSFVYNNGPGAVASSTTVGKRLRARNWRGAADAMLAWNKARNPKTGRLEVLLGLSRRRAAERKLFLMPVRTKPKVVARAKAKVSRPKYLVVDGCPVPYEVAAQIYRVLRKAKQTASSIYRGEDAAGILHSHFKSTQTEIHRAFPERSNPPGRSSHELRGDGRIGSPGEHLEPWRVGVDSGRDNEHDVHAVEAAARYYGWEVYHPYPRGVERHHWNFKRQPKARNPLQAARLIAIRARLPRK